MARIAYRNRWSPRPDSPIDTIPPAQPAVRWWIEPKDFQATWQSQSCQGTGCYKFLIFHAHQIYPWFLDVSKSIPASIPHTESLQPRPTSNRFGQFNQSPTCNEGLFSQIQSNVGAGGHWLRKPELFQLSQLTRMGCLLGWNTMLVYGNGVKLATLRMDDQRQKISESVHPCGFVGIKIGPRDTISWLIRDRLLGKRFKHWITHNYTKLPVILYSIYSHTGKIWKVWPHLLHNCSSAAKSSHWDHPLLRCQSDPIGTVRRSLVPTPGSRLRRPWQTPGDRGNPSGSVTQQNHPSLQNIISHCHNYKVLWEKGQRKLDKMKIRMSINTMKIYGPKIIDSLSEKSIESIGL